jgi:hypothetical protein
VEDDDRVDVAGWLVGKAEFEMPLALDIAIFSQHERFFFFLQQ